MIRVTVSRALPEKGIFDRERVETKFFCDVIQILPASGPHRSTHASRSGSLR